MHIKELRGKKVCILGFGREGQATLRALEKYAPNSGITIADREEDIPTRYQVSGVRFQVGKEYLSNLNKFDIVIKSPGIPPSELATYNLQPTTYNLVSATKIFLDSIANTGAAVIGVTGSKGKSTTASLIYEILRKASCHPERSRGTHRAPHFDYAQCDTWDLQHVHLIGNIGTPALDFLDKAKSGVIFVMELSSYQLMDLTVSPHIAIITSFFPEHLDYHGSLEAYQEAKSHITKFQTTDDIVFYSSASPPSPRGRGQGEGPFAIAMISPGKKVPFSEEDAPVTLEETQLIGTHNLRNIAGAWKVAEYLGIPRDTAIKAIKEFTPLPHRLQSLGTHHGIEWIDDAISTTPESTIAALDAIGDRVATVILGGQDRGNDFTELARRLKNSSVKTIILFPGSGPRMRKTLEVAEVNARLLDAESMQEAVLHAKNHSQFSILNSQFPIVLLSTASPSYNMFKNFEEKGEKFQQCIGLFHAPRRTASR